MKQVPAFIAFTIAMALETSAQTQAKQHPEQTTRIINGELTKFNWWERKSRSELWWYQSAVEDSGHLAGLGLRCETSQQGWTLEVSVASLVPSKVLGRLIAGQTPISCQLKGSKPSDTVHMDVSLIFGPSGWDLICKADGIEPNLAAPVNFSLDGEKSIVSLNFSGPVARKHISSFFRECSRP
jgi:hypothetical protein